MNFKRLTASSVVAGLIGFNTTGMAATPCPSDTNCSGVVDVDDLLEVINSWGPSGTGDPGDINASGAVDVDDLLAVINAWGECQFDFGVQYKNAEAHQIALEMLASNQIIAPQAVYDRIDRDLELIRTAYPALAEQTHSMAWAPNQLIVALLQNQPSGSYDCLNAFYQVIDSDLLFSSGGSTYYVLTLDGKFNAEGLAAIYTALPEVNFAEPNGLVGGQNYWVPSNLGGGKWKWEIDDGWHDCFDGCDCHKQYVLQTDADGNIIEISITQFGQSWCEF